jgi:hypothetical protein
VLCSRVSRGSIPDMWPFKKDRTGRGKVAKDCADDELRERYYAQLQDRKKREKELEWRQVYLDSLNKAIHIVEKEMQRRVL